MNLFLSLLLALSFSPGQAPQGAPGQPPQGAQGQPPPPAFQPPPEQPAPTAPLLPPPPTYVVGPADVLKIAVADDPDIGDKSYTVDAEGQISFWILGRLAVGGLTLRQIQDKVTAALADGFIRNPVVRVEIGSYKSQYVQVLGEVRTPGRIAMSGTKSLLEAIADAGSTSSNASNEIEITHTRRPDGTALGPNEPKEKTTVNFDDIPAAQAFMLRDGDVVTVPKAQQIYINGEVRNQGPLLWRRDMTLTHAVTLAGGLTDRGTYRGARATRIVKGKTIEVKLKEQDKVLPDDVITIKKRLF